MSVKRSGESKKKTFYKGEGTLYTKQMKTIDQDWQKDNYPMDTKKMTIFKEHNRVTKQTWNKAKRSVTEGDGRKESKILSYMDGHTIYKK